MLIHESRELEFLVFVYGKIVSRREQTGQLCLVLCILLSLLTAMLFSQSAVHTGLPCDWLSITLIPEKSDQLAATRAELFTEK